MPEYLAPGVYIEETSYRAKSIEGVSTTTTGFIGPTRFGPVTLEPDIITSLGDFERTYGDGQPLWFGGTSPADARMMPNYVWHAARVFFNEGGRRLYISRVYGRLDDADYKGSDAEPKRQDENDDTSRWLDGHARWTSPHDPGVVLTARFPGSAGNLRIRFELRSGNNILGAIKDQGGQTPVLGAMQKHDVVWIRPDTSIPESPPSQLGDLYLADHDDSGAENDPRKPAYWRFLFAPGSPIASPLDGPPFRLTDKSLPDTDPKTGLSIRVVTLLVSVLNLQGDPIGIWSNLPLDPDHRTAGAQDSFAWIFGASPQAQDTPFIASLPEGLNGLGLLNAIFAADIDAIMNGDRLRNGVMHEIVLDGGSDGNPPSAGTYDGIDDENEKFKTGLKQFEDIDDISIIAAPGSTWNYTDENRAKEANTIISNLLSHAERMRYRIAVIDCAEDQSIAEVRKLRAKLDSKYGAFYYPWVRILDPITRAEIGLPPSGFVAGIYARNDIERSVSKAPANEVVRSALGFEKLLNRAQQEVLNPEGINCFRFFEGRGYRLWGARLVSSDPEWKYVNLRRYFAYLEHSIDKGTQWAVFESNNDLTWANVRRTIEDFLLNEWLNGALLGEKPERAYFVRCDRSTMSQNDLDNGRLVCQIGVAALRPAEFVIFRIGQWTGDRKV
jgi:phage tail sheath protein FI